jgi:hypothetical protein
VELDDLRIVADSSNRTAEGRSRDDVGGEIEATDHGTAAAGGGRGAGRGGPGERGVECDATVEAVGEEVPFRRNGYGGRHHGADRGFVRRRRGKAGARPDHAPAASSGERGLVELGHL